MKNKIRKATLRVLSTVLAVFMLIGVYSVGVSAATDDGVIRNDETGIPDPVLYNYLISEYDTNADGVLQKEEAAQVTILKCANYDLDKVNVIYSLKGLKNCTNLKSLIVTDHKLSNLEGIEGLKLQAVFVYGNQLTDISAISGMHDTLIELNVMANKLSKLPDLRNFDKLYVNPRGTTTSCTNFSVNKLSTKEMEAKLPERFADDIKFWAIDQTPDPEELDLVDEGTGIKVKGTMDPDATLKVEKVESTVEDAVATYDITLRKDGDVIQPSGTITISIPSEIKDCKLFWVKDDGTKVEVNAIYENGNYVFTTDHLSVYALVKKPEPTTTEPVETTTAEPVTTVESVTTVPITDPVTTVEPTTKSVATPDTPIDNNNSNSGSNSSSGSSTTNTNTSNGAVATGNMLGFDNNILIAMIIAATTALIAASKRRNSSK